MKTPTIAPVRQQHQPEVGARAGRGPPTSRRSRTRAITTTVSADEPEREPVLADVVADAEVAEPRVPLLELQRGVAEVEALRPPRSRSRPRRARRAPRASPASSPGAARRRRAARLRPAGRSGSSSASRSSHAHEDDGEDGEPARERERVRADEPVLRAAELTRAEAGAAGDGGDRADDQRLLDEARRARARSRRPGGRRSGRRARRSRTSARTARTGFGAAHALRRVDRPRDGDARRARTRRRAPRRSTPACSVGSTSGAATGSSQSVTGVQNGANWRKPADRGEHGEHGDRPEHRERRLLARDAGGSARARTRSARR